MTIELYHSPVPDDQLTVGRCFVCETWSKRIVVREYAVEMPAPEDGMVEQVVELPVCFDADECERNQHRAVLKKKDRGF